MQRIADAAILREIAAHRQFQHLALPLDDVPARLVPGPLGISESFPGQFRNWFYSLLAMATVLQDSPPFLECFGYATLMAEDGRAMQTEWQLHQVQREVSPWA